MTGAQGPDAASNAGTRPAALVASGLVLLLPMLVVYWPALGYPFLGVDDLHHVVNNPALRDLSWEGIRYLFLEDDRDIRYLPLTYLSFAVELRLFGPDPLVFHAVNLVLHGANTLLVAGIVWRLTRNAPAALVTGLLFSLHPVQVESVAWVMSRKNVLFLFFFLLAAEAYLAFTRLRSRPGGRGLALAALACSLTLYVLACLSRVAAITLPAVLVLLDHFEAREARPRLIPFLRGSLPSKLVYLPPLVLFFALSASSDAPNPFVTEYAFSGLEWVLIVGHNLFFYVAKTLLPVQLGIFYALPAPGALPLRFAVYAALAVALVGVTFACWARGWKGPFLGLSWYLVTILPMAIVLAFFSDLPLLAADRYHYQSSIGLFLLAGLGFAALWRRREAARWGLAAAGVALLGGLGFLAAEHRASFRSTVAVYEQLLEHHPSDEFYYRLALEHHAAGRTEEAFAALEDADRARHRIFFMDFLYYRLRLVELYRQKGDLSAAADQLEAGLASVPNAYEPDAVTSPAAYLALAELRRAVDDVEGERRARELAAAVPPDPSHYFARQWILVAPDAARGFFWRWVDREPESPAAWTHLALHAHLTGHAGLAEEWLEKAAALRDH